MSGRSRIDGSFWRAIAMFRLASLVYAAVLLIYAGGYQRPVAGWLVFGAMVAWTAVTTIAYPRSAGWPLPVIDLVVTAGCLLASPYVQGSQVGAMPVTATWVAGPVLAWAIHGGPWAGVMAALVLAAVDTGLRGLTAFPSNGAILLLLAAVAVGHVSRLARRAERQLQHAAQVEAATRERERLARGIHDSVLQVLALVQRRGAELGGEAAELGRLAGEQERALRELVRSDPVGQRPRRQDGGDGSEGDDSCDGGPADLAALLRRHEAAGVTVSTAAAPLLLPARRAHEVVAAVQAALDNARRHGGKGVTTWIFAEGGDSAVTVTVRDDGPGIPDGRLREAATEGRLGVAQSIRGRIAELGGTVTITSRPGEGTEVELTVPVAAGHR